MCGVCGCGRAGQRGALPGNVEEEARRRGSHGGLRMVRLRILVSGLVQGVGFRPFVRALAVRCAVSGFVRNEGDRVRIEVEGEAEAVRRFRAELTDRPPAAAHRPRGV